MHKCVTPVIFLELQLSGLNGLQFQWNQRHLTINVLNITNRLNEEYEHDPYYVAISLVPSFDYKKAL
jgi:hypothetical protein